MINISGLGFDMNAIVPFNELMNWLKWVGQKPQTPRCYHITHTDNWSG